MGMKKRLKILHVFNGSFVSGPEVSTIPGLAFLPQENEVECATVFLEETRLEAKVKSACRSYAQSFGLKVFVVDVHSRFDLGAIIRLRKLIQEEKYSHVHGQDVKATFYLRLATLGLSLQRVSTFHGFARFTLKEKLYERLYFLAVRNFNKIITVSSASLLRIQENYFWLAKKVFLIENAIVRPHQKNLPEINETLEKIASLPPHPWGIMLARFSVEKNHLTLFKALRRLSVHEPLVIWLFGFGELEKELKRLAHEMGIEKRVIFGGQLPLGSSYLSAFDYFFLVSTTESLPMSLLEAASMGLTVVGSDIPGIRTVVPSIDYGFLSDPLDEEELALNIKLALSIPLSQRKQMGENLKIRTLEKFSIKEWATKHLEVYSQ